MYALVSENLTNLGGPMGSEYTYPNWRKYFHSVDNAKAAAEEDYNKSRGPIQWVKTEHGWRSQDLGYVMYHINSVQVED